MSLPNPLTVDTGISPIAHDDLERMVNQVDESDPEIFVFFETEAFEQLNKIEALLHTWDARKIEFPHDELHVSFHTLKGAANSIGQLRIGGLAGGMQRVMVMLKEKQIPVDQPGFIKTTVTVLQTIRLLLQEARAPQLYTTPKELLVRAINLILEFQHKLAQGIPV